MSSFEVNFDGLVGSTHNYAGLSFGNVASSVHGGKVSSPKKAALQGLEKMRALHNMGLKQAVLPPHERPHVPTLRRLGFSGNTDAQILQQAAAQAPQLLASVSSASTMWVANAATVSPGADTADGKTHFTPANLMSMLHRSMEVDTTGKILRAIFNSKDYVHHQALPGQVQFADEGAANHTRLCTDYGNSGVELFVHGDGCNGQKGPQKYPARQTLGSAMAISRSHGLDPDSTVIAQQNPEAIDAGVFHNDVIAVGNRDLLFFHERAFTDNQLVCRQLQRAFGEQEISFIEVLHSDVDLTAAVASYMFNSQLLSIPGQAGTSIIVPSECREVPQVKLYLDELESSHSAITAIHYFDLRESMHNGGGPACLRLRVVLQEQQLLQLGARVLMDDALYTALREWINTHYREKLAPGDLADPQLLNESRTALDQLTQILKLPAIYEFQQD